jgi:hypothetical protein
MARLLRRGSRARGKRWIRRVARQQLHFHGVQTGGVPIQDDRLLFEPHARVESGAKLACGDMYRSYIRKLLQRPHPCPQHLHAQSSSMPAGMNHAPAEVSNRAPDVVATKRHDFVFLLTANQNGSGINKERGERRLLEGCKIAWRVGLENCQTRRPVTFRVRADVHDCGCQPKLNWPALTRARLVPRTRRAWRWSRIRRMVRSFVISHGMINRTARPQLQSLHNR